MKKFVFGDLSGLAIGVAFIGDWVTHVVVTIVAEQWIFLLIGAFFPPIGIVHCIGLWFGFF